MANGERRMEVSQPFGASCVGLSAQIRRAAVSVPSNVAEGWGRHYTAERTATRAIRSLNLFLHDPLASSRGTYSDSGGVPPVIKPCLARRRRARRAASVWPYSVSSRSSKARALSG